MVLISVPVHKRLDTDGTARRVPQQDRARIMRYVVKSTFRQILFAMLAWGLMTITVHQSHAQESEAALVQAMKKLGENWQALSRTEDVLIIGCANNTFTGVRLASGAAVSVDLRRTSSLMSPYLGIVRISGRFQRNSSPEDGSCSKTLSEAKRNMNWHDNNQDYDMKIYYQVNGAELWLADGNDVFWNSFMRQPGAAQFDPNSAWLKAFRFPLMCRPLTNRFEHDSCDTAIQQ